MDTGIQDCNDVFVNTLRLLQNYAYLLDVSCCHDITLQFQPFETLAELTIFLF